MVPSGIPVIPTFTAFSIPPIFHYFFLELPTFVLILFHLFLIFCQFERQVSLKPKVLWNIL